MHILKKHTLIAILKITNKIELTYYLINILIIITSKNITIKNKNISNLTKNDTLIKFFDRLRFRYRSNDLNVDFEFKYFKYENNIKLSKIKYVREFVVVKIVEITHSFDIDVNKKKIYLLIQLSIN